jgi:hypothetical protein
MHAFVKTWKTNSSIGRPKTPRDAAKPRQTQMDKHEDKIEPGGTVIDFPAEVTLMATLCIIIT